MAPASLAYGGAPWAGPRAVESPPSAPLGEGGGRGVEDCWASPKGAEGGDSTARGPPAVELFGGLSGLALDTEFGYYRLLFR